MAMRDEGYQLISIERVDADSIFNDINHWVATSSYRFLEYTRRQTKTFAEEQGTQSTVTESSSITPQHLDVFGSAFTEAIQENIKNIQNNTNDSFRALYTQMIKEEQLTALEQNIVKTISVN